MKLVLSRTAWNDIEEIADYIGRDSVTHSSRFVSGLFEEMERIAENPFHIPIYPGPPGGFRRGFFGAYLLFFRVTGETVHMERVLHGKRDIPQLLRS